MFRTLLLVIAASIGPMVGAGAQVQEVVPGEPFRGQAPARERADELISDLRERTGRRFERYQTKRFIVVSDAKASWVRARSSILERTWHQYFRFTRRAGFDVTEPTEPLVAVMFSEHSDYASWAEDMDGVSAPWVGGYYTTKRNKIVLFDDRTSPAYLDARAQLDEAAGELREADRRAVDARRSGDGRTARAIETAANDFAQQVRAGGLSLEDSVNAQSVARTVHEAVHQLSFNSGLQRPDRTWPFWFSEGLASAFETEDTRSGFGPRDGYGPRTEDFESRVRGEELMDWRALSAMAVAPEDGDSARAAYSQAYGLFRHLERYERHELVEFVSRINEQDPGRRGLGELFEEVFGEADKLGRAVERAAAQD